MYTHLDRSIFLSGTLSPPILINSSNAIKTNEYNVGMDQDININNLYLQGGPGKSVATFQKKIIEGNISLFPRITESNILESGVIDLINAGQNYTDSVTITTFLLPYNGNLTANSPPYIVSTNSMIFDICVVKGLTINAKQTGSVTATMEIIGQTDFPNTTPLNLPSDDSNLYRNLSWYDCSFSRNGSQLENVHEVEIKVLKDIDQRYFLMTYGTQPVTFDRSYSTGIKSVWVEFKIIEHITSIFDIFTFSMGGFLDNINFSGTIGPISFNIPNATMKISNKNLNSDIIERTTMGYYRLIPNTPDTVNFLFQIG